VVFRFRFVRSLPQVPTLFLACNRSYFLPLLLHSQKSTKKKKKININFQKKPGPRSKTSQTSRSINPKQLKKGGLCVPGCSWCRPSFFFLVLFFSLFPLLFLFGGEGPLPMNGPIPPWGPGALPTHSPAAANRNQKPGRPTT